MLWAKISGHPWWPCIVAPDPISLTYTKLLPSRYHLGVYIVLWPCLVFDTDELIGFQEGRLKKCGLLIEIKFFTEYLVLSCPTQIHHTPDTLTCYITSPYTPEITHPNAVTAFSR